MPKRDSTLTAFGRNVARIRAERGFSYLSGTERGGAEWRANATRSRYTDNREARKPCGMAKPDPVLKACGFFLKRHRLDSSSIDTRPHADFMGGSSE